MLYLMLGGEGTMNILVLSWGAWRLKTKHLFSQQLVILALSMLICLANYLAGAW